MKDAIYLLATKRVELLAVRRQPSVGHEAQKKIRKAKHQLELIDELITTMNQFENEQGQAKDNL